jgi:rsbT co-antagonist protein RsbR
LTPKNQAMNGLERNSAHQLILDITGVPVVDGEVARGLMLIVQAARLLGCEMVLVGVCPEVAETIVGLGADLMRVTARSSLRAGIEYALRSANGREHDMNASQAKS